MAHVLFVCLHNAGRSQMSRALFVQAAAGRHSADSAGTTPAARVHPHVAAVMAEIGFDIADQRPQRLTEAIAQRAEVIVTMGCGDECPYIPGKRYLDWDLPDPARMSIAAVRDVRDEIDQRVRRLVEELDANRLPTAG